MAAEREESSARTQKPTFHVRVMRSDEIPAALQVWTETGLVEGTHTIDTWYGVDPDGFFVAVDSQTGRILGVVAGVNLSKDVAFVGMYAVRKSCRGQGIGQRIWSAMMAHVGDRNVGLNSVPEHLHTYRDLAGFSVVSPWTSGLYEGLKVTPESLLNEEPGVDVVPYYDGLLPRLIEYDAGIHGFRRDKIVSLTVKEEDSVTVVAVRNDGGDVCGYGGIRGNVQYTALAGPVYADSPNVAEVLYRRLLESFPRALEQGVTLATVSTNQDGQVIAEKFGLTKQMDLPRCYTGGEVDAEFSKIYAHQALNFSTF